MSHMDIEQIEDAIRFEESRSDGPPAGFPPLPEVPGARYTDEPFFALEQQHVWRNSWICVGRDDDVPEPGDYKVFDKLGLPILLVRGKDGILRSFYNTCRHRGASVVQADCGRATLLRCPYHAWSYSLEGKLIGVPDQKDFGDLDKSRRGLVAIRCEIWNGLAFINLGTDPQTVEEYLDGIAANFAPVDIGSMRVVERTLTHVKCNWKAAIDAFLEVYHINAIHPETVGQMLERQSAVMTMYQNGHSRMVTRRTSRGANFGEQGDAPDVASVPAHMREHSFAFFAFPNLVIPADGVGFPIQLYWPIGKDECIVEAIFMGPDWGEGHRPAFWDSYLETFSQILDEDVENLDSIQKSLKSGALGGMRLSYQERRIYWFHEELDRRIGAGNIPSDLQVEAVLSDHMRWPIAVAAE